MRTLFLAFAALLAFATSTLTPAHAAVVNTETHRTLYNCCGTGQGAVSTLWDTSFGSTLTQTSHIAVANSGTVAILVGVGASGAEVSALTIPASSAMTVYPFVVGRGKKIAIKPLGSTGGVGEVDLNLAY
jgi:hypothetical protein